MAVYVVTYDLKLGHGSHDYQDLYDAFAELESVKILYSVYLVAVSWNAAELHNYLKGFMDPQDRIWVSRVSSDHSGWIMSEGVDWLQQHPPA